MLAEDGGGVGVEEGSEAGSAGAVFAVGHHPGVSVGGEVLFAETALEVGGVHDLN